MKGYKKRADILVKEPSISTNYSNTTMPMKIHSLKLKAEWISQMQLKRETVNWKIKQKKLLGRQQDIKTWKTWQKIYKIWSME